MICIAPSGRHKNLKLTAHFCFPVFLYGFAKMFVILRFYIAVVGGKINVSRAVDSLSSGERNGTSPVTEILDSKTRWKARR